MSFTSLPIHRISLNPTSPILYLATSNCVHKYNLKSSSVEATFTSPNPESYAQFLETTSEWLFITGGEKLLRVLNACTLESVAEFYLLKRASAIAYDSTESMIIVTDKTGEAYSFPWPLSPPLLENYEKIKSLPPNDEQNPLTKPTDERFLGTFVLGHSSSIVACSLATTQWGRALVTVDRDEHVRISVFPQTWIIHAMGLGHMAFVSCVVAVDGGIVTGGGDNRVILWGFNGVLRMEYTISHGSCVRLIRPWKDMIVVVGEEYILLHDEADRRSSTLEVLKLDGLNVVQKIDVGENILDVAVNENMIYVSVDGQGKAWILEYQYAANGFKRVGTDSWNRPDTSRPESKVELYWLESLRKKVGVSEDD